MNFTGRPNKANYTAVLERLEAANKAQCAQILDFMKTDRDRRAALDDLKDRGLLKDAAISRLERETSGLLEALRGRDRVVIGYDAALRSRDAQIATLEATVKSLQDRPAVTFYPHVADHVTNIAATQVRDQKTAAALADRVTSLEVRLAGVAQVLTPPVREKLPDQPWNNAQRLSDVKPQYR